MSAIIDALRLAEQDAEHANIVSVVGSLRHLPFDEFCRVLARLPTPEWPSLSRALPSMAPAEVQRAFTGADGDVLLDQTIAFVRSLEAASHTYRDRSLSGTTLLDYGCGWGRMLRAALYFVDPDQLYGCDPWQDAINLCEAHRIPASLAISDYLPSDISFGVRFDAILAFSVFTHLSRRAAIASFSALRKCAKDDALLAITVRPVEYWRDVQPSQAMQCEHARTGFAFIPHNRAPIDGDVTYGDTSMSMEMLAELSSPQWRIVGTERNMIDAYQQIVFLQPA